MNKLLNMKSLKTLSLILGTCVSFYACTDLDEELVGEFTESYSEANPAAAFISAGSGGGGADALGAAFSKLRDGSAGHFGHFTAQTLPSDEAWIATKGGDWYDGGILIDLHKHNFLANNGILGNTWNQLYGGINAVNDAMGDASADDAKQLRAVRAFHYYRLMDLYGSVKYVTEAGDEGQLSRAAMFEKVEGELLDLVGLTRDQLTNGDAPTAFGSTNTSYRVNHFAVMGLLAKLYLNGEVYTRATAGGTGTAMWEQAYAAANYVIENSPYRLATSPSTQAAVGSAGAVMSNVNLGRLNSNEVNVGGNQQYPDGSSSADNIYAQDNMEGYTALFAANNDQANPEFIWSIEYDEVTAGGMNFAKMTLHYGSQQTFNFEAQPWNGYATLADFYNDYDDANDVRKHTNHLAGVQRTFNGGIVRDFAKEPNDASPDLEFTGDNAGGIFPNGLRQAGARLGKFSFKQFGRPDQDNDYPIVRLGDLYLVRAEANARRGGSWNGAAALADVNIIRARSGAAAKSASDITESFFLAERGREMFQESTRRQDQIRFGQYRAGADSGRRADSTPTDTHKIVMPIPLDAINASNGSLSQNTGY